MAEHDTSQKIALIVTPKTVETTLTALPSSSSLLPFCIPPPLFSQISSLVKGVEQGMASGEYPIRLITPNVQLAVTSTLVTTIGDLTLPVPPTMTDEASERSQPKVTLGPKGLSSCIKIGSYAQLSLLQWSVNPYLSSKPVRSPLLRISSAIQADEPVLSGSISNAARSSNTYKLPAGVPAYTLSIQFSTPQYFDFAAAVNYTSTSRGRGRGNYTIPVCTQYNGAAYVPCQGCNISTYTNYNVTYSCYDVSQVCPTTIVRRGLEGLNAKDDLEDPEVDENIESAADDICSYSRRLQSTNDDGDATAASPTTYGTLVQSIGAELSSVLSSNPFARPSAAVLAFVSCLSGFICLMLLCLLKQDDEEKTTKNYVKADIYAKARKLLEEDIRDGRSGDHSVNYQEHLTQCKGEAVSGTDIVRKIRRVSSKGTAFGMKMEKNSPPKQSKPIAESLQPSLFKKAQYDGDSDCGSGSCTDSDDDYLDDGKGKSHEKEAAIIEFLHVLFPGRAIFKERSNFYQIVAVNHDYFKMFGGSTMTRSRTVRFLELVVLVLTTLFVDTVFFSVFYTVNQCSLNADQVKPMYDSKLRIFIFGCSQSPFIPNIRVCEAYFLVCNHFAGVLYVCAIKSAVWCLALRLERHEFVLFSSATTVRPNIHDPGGAVDHRDEHSDHHATPTAHR
jgi:hypothetical protein